MVERMTSGRRALVFAVAGALLVGSIISERIVIGALSRSSRQQSDHLAQIDTVTSIRRDARKTYVRLLESCSAAGDTRDRGAAEIVAMARTVEGEARGFASLRGAAAARRQALFDRVGAWREVIEAAFLQPPADAPRVVGPALAAVDRAVELVREDNASSAKATDARMTLLRTWQQVFRIAVACAGFSLFMAIRAWRTQLQAERREHQLKEEHLERQLRFEKSLDQARKLEAVGRLAAGVAHEVNTPVQFVSDSLAFLGDSMKELMGVVQSLQLVQRSVLDGTPSVEAASRAAEVQEAVEWPYLADAMPKAIDRCVDGLHRVAKIVQSLKDFAHPDSSEMSNADLNRAIESTLTIARGEYKHVADLETDFHDLPPIACHVGEVNQAVLNIVVNAAHAIEDVVQGTDRKGRILVRTRSEAQSVVISVQDSGGGIPESIRDRIFDPFFTTKEVGKGSGQGLAIARTVVHDRHGGELWYESHPGAGTTFFIRLPTSGRKLGRAAA